MCIWLKFDQVIQISINFQTGTIRPNLGLRIIFLGQAVPVEDSSVHGYIIELFFYENERIRRRYVYFLKLYWKVSFFDQSISHMFSYFLASQRSPIGIHLNPCLCDVFPNKFAKTITESVWVVQSRWHNRMWRPGESNIFFLNLMIFYLKIKVSILRVESLLKRVLRNESVTYYVWPQSVGMSLQSPRSATTPRILTLDVKISNENVTKNASFFFQFFPPTWFICSTSVNHLLLVLNCIMNFIVYCCFNEKFKHILFQQQDKNQQNNSSPQQNQQIPSRNAEPKQRNITRVTGVIQTNFNHDPSEFAKKSTYVFDGNYCLLW